MVIEEFSPGELTVPGAARRANIPESQVRYYLQTSQLAFVRRWGRVVIREDDLMRLVEAKVESQVRASDPSQAMTRRHDSRESSPAASRRT